MKRDEYTNKNYWEDYWENETRGMIQFCFGKLLNQYIPWNTVKSYMEIGGAPGSVMAFMNKEYGLSVSTIDFTDKERIFKFLRSNGVENFDVYQEDFLTVDVKPHYKKYDIVASWGFLEHFEKKITAKFIEKQKCMVCDGGYLIVEIPNIRRIFWLAYWIFNRKLIRIHNLKVMDLPWLKKCVRGEKFELLYASYYFTMNSQNEYFVKHKRLGKICERM